ncbi:MAG: hypothetical protein CVT74_10020, partial [Alphaproteobacteria bacterium HGW-Alphaproteobacteria-13]
ARPAAAPTAPKRAATAQPGRGKRPSKDGPRPPRPDSGPRRAPSPHSPFAGLADLLAKAGKD